MRSTTLLISLAFATLFCETIYSDSNTCPKNNSCVIQCPSGITCNTPDCSEAAGQLSSPWVIDTTLNKQIKPGTYYFNRVDFSGTQYVCKLTNYNGSLIISSGNGTSVESTGWNTSCIAPSHPEGCKLIWKNNN